MEPMAKQQLFGSDIKFDPFETKNDNSRTVAIRNAQLKLLKAGRTKNPLFWSAFVMYGDGVKY